MSGPDGQGHLEAKDHAILRSFRLLSRISPSRERVMVSAPGLDG
jgi:hypothetical protein